MVLEKLWALRLELGDDLFLVGVLEKAEYGGAKEQVEHVEDTQAEQTQRVLVKFTAHFGGDYLAYLASFFFLVWRVIFV